MLDKETYKESLVIRTQAKLLFDNVEKLLKKNEVDRSLTRIKKINGLTTTRKGYSKKEQFQIRKNEILQNRRNRIQAAIKYD
jgi:hypothetical protein